MALNRKYRSTDYVDALQILHRGNSEFLAEADLRHQCVTRVLIEKPHGTSHTIVP